MKLHWISAAILSAAVAAGCGDKGQNTENPDQAAVAPAGEATGNDPAAAPPVTDNSAARPDSSGPQTAPPPATRTPSRPATAPRTEAAPRAETRPQAPPARVVRELTVPAGTSLPLELMTALSSETAQVETPVQARLRRSI